MKPLNGAYDELKETLHKEKQNLSKDYDKCMIDNMLQALDHQRDKLWDSKESYYRSGHSDEWNELNETLTKMIMALSL